MFTRQSIVLVIGAATTAIGGWLFLHPYQGEPLWAEWLLAPILVFLGLLMVIIGTSIYFFVETPETATSKNLPIAAKPHR